MEIGSVSPSRQSETTASFGYWVRRRRMALDLTQDELAHRVNCARVTISKIERDERRPSRQMAELLADQLAISEEDRDLFLAVASRERAVDVLPLSDKPIASISSRLRAASPHVLPVPSTSFVGRTTEINEVVSLLGDKYCRLLTLVGPGGSGKTRLALQAAEEIASAARERTAPYWPAGVCFVPLQSVSVSEQVASAVANALHWEQYQGHDPEQELLSYLRDKRLLLILDNFEHLLPAAPLLLKLLRGAPKIKLLVTSRAPLNLEAEWTYPVVGMSVPMDGDEGGFDSSDAVMLFAERARRVRPDFSLESERANVLQICRLVEGMPLAIELAAAWLRRLSCAAIASEIDSNLDILSSDHLDLHERHRSMRVVFDQSWELLSEEEQAPLMALSVFRGGTTREAAEAVAGATLPILSKLVDQSWLEITTSGRYTIHELQRQYVYERLSESPDLLHAACDAHSAHYMAFLTRPARELLARNNTDVIAAFHADIDNILGAWQWAVDHRRSARIRSAITALYWFSWLTPYHLEGKAAFDYAVHSLRDAGDDADLRIAHAYALAALGSINIWMGDASTATRLLDESVATLRGLPNSRRELGFAVGALGWSLCNQSKLEEAMPLILEAAKLDEETDQPEQEAWIYSLLGSMAWRRCEFDDVEQWYQRALNLGREIDDGRTMAHALLGLGRVARIRGHYVSSRRFLEEGLLTSRRHGIVAFEISALIGLGLLCDAVGDFETASKYLEDALSISRAYGKEPEVAEALNALAHVRVSQADYRSAQDYYDESSVLVEKDDIPADRFQNVAGKGRLALHRDEYAAAIQLYQDAVSISRESRIRLDMGRALVGLGLAQHRKGEDSAARQHLLDALKEGLSVELEPLLLDSVSAFAVILAAAGERTYAAQLASLVERHEASTAETRNRAASVMADVTAHLSPHDLDRIGRSEPADITSVAHRLIAAFARPEDSDTERTPLATKQTLIEPLSDREIQVLRLVAEGRSNREIGRELYLALGTVKSHVHHIFQKLDVKSRTQAVARAVDLKLL